MISISKSFKSFGHLLATGYQKLVADAPKVVAAINQLESHETQVEAATAVIPKYGPLAVPAEKLFFALAGEFAHVIISTGAAGKQKFLDAGMDKDVVDSMEALVNDAATTKAVLSAL